MGATCLGKPRNNRQLMNMGKELDIKPRYISTHNSINQNKQLYVGQNEGNKLKIDSTLLSCTVCMQNYNTNSRQPVIICNNYHTFCKNCIQIIKNGNKQCPTCRLPLNQPIRNRDIYQLIEDNLKIIEEGKLEVIEAVQSKYIEVSVDMKNNPLINSFWVNQKRIMKIQNDKKWVGFVSQQILPKNRQCIYTVKIVHSQCNNIEIGIVAQGYILQSNVTAAQSVMYHLADGNVLANFGKKKNEWRKVGRPVERQKKIVLQVRVNGIQQSVSWWLGDTKLGQGRFGDWLIHQPCVAYVMMYHPEDVIQLNA